MLNFFFRRPLWMFPALIGVLTVVCHLTYSIWFWTASPTRAAKTDLRLSGEAYLQQLPTWDTEHEADAAFYNRGAVEVLRTGVPRTRSGMFFEHAPLYAYFVAFCYKIGGVRMLSLVVAQSLLSGCTAFLIGLTAAGLASQFARLAGTISASLVLINLQLAGYTGTASPTTALLFLFSLAIWALVCGKGWLRYPLFIGALVLGVYMQAAFFVIAFSVVAWLLFSFWRERQRWFLVGASVLVAFALTKPAISFLINRQQETHSTEPPTAILWEANNPYYQSMTVFSLWERRPGNHWSQWKLTPEEESEFNRYIERAGGKYTGAALLWIREHPVDYLELCVVRLRAALGPVTAQMSPLNKKISTVTWLLVFPAGFIGLWRLRGSVFGKLALFALLFEASFETLVLAGWQPRYRLPIDILLFAAAGGVYAGWLCALAKRVGWLVATPSGPDSHTKV
jgi:hypothetical protein